MWRYFCSWLLTTRTSVMVAQGEALINDKINWLALAFAVYSVSDSGVL